jgi:hypothetical protein
MFAVDNTSNLIDIPYSHANFGQILTEFWVGIRIINIRLQNLILDS